MEIVKEISELSKEVERLSDVIERYGDSVSKVSAMQSKVQQLFGEATQAGASSKNVKELSAAYSELTKGYQEVENAQNDLIKQEQDLQTIISKRQKLLARLEEARKQEIAAGDARAASEYTEQIAQENIALQENVAAMQKVQSTVAELGQSKSKLGDIGGFKFEITGSLSDNAVDSEQIKNRAQETAKFVNGAFGEIANSGANKTFKKVNAELSSVNQRLVKSEEELSKIKEMSVSVSKVQPVSIASSSQEVDSSISQLTKQQEQLNNAYEVGAERLQALTRVNEQYKEGRAALYKAQARAQELVQKGDDDENKVQQNQAALQAINQQILSSNKQIDAYDRKIEKLQASLSQLKETQTAVGQQLSTALRVQDDKQILNFDTSKASADELVEKLAEIQNRVRSIKEEQQQAKTSGNDEQVKSLTTEKAKLEQHLKDLDSGKTQGGNALKTAYANDLKDINAQLDECAKKAEQAKAEQEGYNAYLQQLNALAAECQSGLKKLGASNPFNTHGKSVEELNKLLQEEKNKLAENYASQAKTKETIAAANKEKERTIQLAEQSLISEKTKEKVIQQQNDKIKEANALLEQQKRSAEVSKAKISTFQGAIGAATPSATSNSTPDAGKLSTAAKAAEELAKGLSQIKRGFAEMAQGGTAAAAGLKMVTSGIKSVSKALLTLLANPWVLLITAIVAAFVALGKALTSFFTKTEEGQAKFAKFQGVFNGLKATIEQFSIKVGRLLSEIGTLLVSCGKMYVKAISTPIFAIVTIVRQGAQAIKNAFRSIGKGDFSGALNGLQNAGKQMKDTFSAWNKEFATIADEIKNNWNNISDFDMSNLKDNVMVYTQLQQDIVALAKAQREWNKERAEYDNKISAKQETMYSGSRVEQLEAASTMQGLINEKYNKELALAKEDLRIKKTIVSVAGNAATVEQLEAQQSAEMAVLELETKRNNELRTMARRYKSLQDAIANQQKQQEQALQKQSETNSKQARDNAYKEELSSLQQQLKYETDITKQRQLREQISRLTLDHELQGLKEERKAAMEQLELDKKADIRTNYGDKAVTEYTQTGKLSSDKQGILSFYDKKQKGINEQYDLKEQGVTDSSVREQEQTEFDKRIENYTAFVEQTLAIEEQYQQRLADIRARYNLAEDADLSKYGEKTAIGRDVAAAGVERDRAQAIVKRDTGIGGNTQDTQWVTDLAQLGGQVAGKAMEEIRAVYDEFIAEVEKQIKTTTQARNDAKKTAESEKEFQASAGQQLSDVNAQLEGEGLTPEDEAALLQQRAELEAQIAESKERQMAAEASMTGSQQRLNQLTNVRARAEGIAANATANAATASQIQSNKTKSAVKGVRDSLVAVRDASDAVADTFGGALSQKAKKAVGVISDIADFGITAIDSISSVVDGTSQAMTATTGTATTAMKTMETASVILTVISIAVQLVMKIVDIAKQFTKSAQMQDAIDAQSEKVDELKRKQEKLEQAYQNSVGTAYYKDMAKAANSYSSVIAAQNKKLQQSRELYEYQKALYGEDSDKTKEAKTQMEEAEDDLADFKQSQIDQWNELMEGLSGTSLTTFSESLADALIEGFENGKEGIDDVWEDTMDDLMRTMMKQQLALAIQDMFDGTFQKLNNMTKNGDLTQSEIDSIMAEFDAQSEKAKYLAEKYYDLMSERGLLDDADAEGSEGFGQMTQDTADALNARFTALQIEGANVVEAAQALVIAVTDLGADSKLNVASLQTLMYNSGIALQVAQEQLDQLQVIADNTALLADTNDRLKAIQQNTARL